MKCVLSLLSVHIVLIVIGAESLADEDSRNIFTLNSKPIPDVKDLDDTIKNYLKEQLKIDKKIHASILEAGAADSTQPDKWDFTPFKKPTDYSQHKKRSRKRKRHHSSKKQVINQHKLKVSPHDTGAKCLRDDCLHLAEKRSKNVYKAQETDNVASLLTEGLHNENDAVLTNSGESRDKDFIRRHLRKFKHYRDEYIPEEILSPDTMSEDMFPTDDMADASEEFSSPEAMPGEEFSSGDNLEESEIVQERAASPSLPPGLPPDLAAKIKQMQPKGGGAGLKKPKHFPAGGKPPKSGGSNGLPLGMPSGGPAGSPLGFPPGGSSGNPPGLAPAVPLGALAGGSPQFSAAGPPPGMAAVGAPIVPPPHLPAGLKKVSGTNAGVFPKATEDYTWLKHALKAAVDGKAVKAALKKDVLRSTASSKMAGAVKPHYAAGFSVQYTSDGCSEIASFKTLFSNQAASACMMCEAGATTGIGGESYPIGLHSGLAPSQSGMPSGMPPAPSVGMPPGMAAGIPLGMPHAAPPGPSPSLLSGGPTGEGGSPVPSGLPPELHAKLMPARKGYHGPPGGGKQLLAMPGLPAGLGGGAGVPQGLPPTRRRRTDDASRRYRRWTLLPHRTHSRRWRYRWYPEAWMRVQRDVGGRCVPICEIRHVKVKCTVQGQEQHKALAVVGFAMVPLAKDFKKCSGRCEHEWELLLQYAAAEKLRAYFASGEPIAAAQPPNTPVPSSWQVEKVLRCPSSELRLEAGFCYPQGNWLVRAILSGQRSQAMVAGLCGSAALAVLVVVGLLLYFKVLKLPAAFGKIFKGFKLKMGSVGGSSAKKAGQSDTLGEGGAGTVEFSEEPPPPPPAPE